MRIAKPVWKSSAIADLPQIKVYTRSSPLWIWIGFIVACSLAWASGFLAAKICACLGVAACLYSEFRGFHLDVHLKKSIDGKSVDITRLQVFRKGNYDLRTLDCDWRLLIPLSGWDRTGIEVNSSTSYPVIPFRVSRILFTPTGGVKFVVEAGDNRVAYNLDDLALIPLRDGSTIHYYTERIGYEIRSGQFL